MARILIRDLTPATEYKAQVRVSNGSEFSEWSRLFPFTTVKDNIAPGPPEALTFVFEGSTAIASWTKPTIDEFGNPLNDLKDFNVKIYPTGAPTSSFSYDVLADRFEFTFEMNNLLYNGTPKGDMTVEVRARDTTGNLSAPATARALNTPPTAPANIVATAITDGVNLKWDPNPDHDFAYFEVYASTTTPVVTDATTRFYRGAANTASYTVVTGHAKTYFIVKAFDVFGLSSAGTEVSATPLKPYTIDTVAPAAPTGVTATSAIDESLMSVNVDVSWTAVTADDLGGYKVRYSASSTGPFSYIDADPTATKVRIRELLPGTAYNIGVQAYDHYGNFSTFTSITHTTAGDTTAPAAPTGVNMLASLTAITMFWNDNTELDTRRGAGSYEAQVDTVNTFDSANLKTRTVNARVVSIDGLIASTPAAPSVYYGRVRAIDANGNPGPWTATTPASVTMGAAYAGAIGGDIVAAGTLAGGSVIAGTLDAASLKADTAINRNLFVDSTITVGLNNSSPGQIKSFDFTATSGYSLTRSGLEIRSGTVAARALEIQEGQNLMHPAFAGFEFSTQYYAAAGISVANGTYAIDTANVRFESQNFKHTNTSTTAESYVYLPGSIQVEPNTTYILSAYAYPSAATQVQLFVRFNDGAHAGSPNIDLAATTQQRVSLAFTTSATQTSVEVRLDVNTPGGVVWWDGIQLERKFGSLNTPSQWKPPGMTRIDGGIIRTGEIRSTALGPVDSQPAWSLGLTGNATLNDALVRGKIVVGAAGATNASISIASHTVGTTGAQWSIRGDGTFDIKSGTGARIQLSSGGLVASNGTIDTVTINSGGGFNFRTGTNGVIFDNNGLRVLDANGAAVVSLNSNGSAEFKGNITGASGTFSGSITGATGDFAGTVKAENLTGTTISGKTITGATITGSTIRTADTGKRVEVNASDNVIRWYDANGDFRGAVSADAGGITIGNSQGNATIESYYADTIVGYRGGLSNLPNTYIRCGTSGNIYFIKTPYVQGVGWVSTEGHGVHGVSSVNGRTGAVSGLAESGHGHSGAYVLGDATLWIRSSGDNNHRLAYGGSFGDGPQMWGWNHWGVTINAYSTGASAMRLDSAAHLRVGGSITANTSSEKVKRNVRTIDDSAVAKINKLRPVRFQRKDLEADHAEYSRTYLGLIAEEVRSIYPEAVLEDDRDPVNGLLALSYSSFVVPLIKAVQELSAELEAIKKRLPPAPA